MKHLRTLLTPPSLTGGEKWLWSLSTLLVLAAGIFWKSEPVALAASLIGPALLILDAKGHPTGQLLTVVFSILYGILSFRQAYYGEMLTYLGMTAPMAAWALFEWLRHPAEEGKPEVKVNRLARREIVLMCVLAVLVTAFFCPVLHFFGTARLALSTLSVTTSFFAVYLTARRSAAFPLAYAANDAVLIALWSLAAIDDPEAVMTLLCFAVFLVNDLYGYINWRRMRGRQGV